MGALIGVRFWPMNMAIAKAKDRINPQGLDENGYPIIVECKRCVNENVINQGFFNLIV